MDVWYAGSLYYKYDDDDADAVVDGYPRPISQDFGPRPNSTDAIPDNLDAVWFDGVSSLIYFFKDEWVSRYYPTSSYLFNNSRLVGLKVRNAHTPCIIV